MAVTVLRVCGVQTKPKKLWKSKWKKQIREAVITKSLYLYPKCVEAKIITSIQQCESIPFALRINPNWFESIFPLLPVSSGGSWWRCLRRTLSLRSSWPWTETHPAPTSTETENAWYHHISHPNNHATKRQKQSQKHKEMCLSLQNIFFCYKASSNRKKSKLLIKKTTHPSFGQNFNKYKATVKILSLPDSQQNFPCIRDRENDPSFTVLLHYLVKSES